MIISGPIYCNFFDQFRIKFCSVSNMFSVTTLDLLICTTNLLIYTMGLGKVNSYNSENIIYDQYLE